MHSKHSKAKKRSPIGAIIAAVVIVLALAAAFIFFVKPALGKMKDSPLPEAPALTDEVIEEPEPVDMREYVLDYPVIANEAVTARIDEISTSIMDEFCAKYDGSSPAVLKTSYITGANADIFSFYHVPYYSRAASYITANLR